MLVPAKELEGVLLVDKPTDHTSHDVVARLRGKLRMRRIGHAGTLDPMATGLLVILVGKATRISQYLMSVDNTQDAEGEVLETRPVPSLTEPEIRQALQGFIGDQYQLPPMFSAIKIDGVPLYKRAREGEEVEREPRFIRVVSYELTRWASPELDFRVHCTKGTYVRTLAHDLGQRLGCGAHLKALRRLSSGDLTMEKALTLDQIMAMPIPEIERHLVPTLQAAPRIAL
jgi:tRNA pseudouridine55 synthase